MGTIWRYYCPFRPPGLGAVPRFAVVMRFYEDRVPVAAIGGRKCWGHVDYAAELSQQDVYGYELIPDPGNPVYRDYD